MKVVYNWLKEFVDISAGAEEIASRLALAGTNVASVETGHYGQGCGRRHRENRGARYLQTIHRSLDSRRESPAFASLAERSLASRRCREHQQRCGRH
jgi:hypothetical protein